MLPASRCRLTSCDTVKITNPLLIHHGRDDAGTITTRILGAGTFRPDPPGIVLDGLFGPE